MRTISGTVVVAGATASSIVLFPNGARNANTGGDRDVWLGSCLIQELRLSASATIIATVTIYNGIDTVAGPNVVVRGGTGVTERHRVQPVAGTDPVGTLGGVVDPIHTTNAAAISLTTQITNQQVASTFSAGLAAGTAFRSLLDFGIPLGATIRVEFAATGTGTFSASCDFVPWVSGSYRKRAKSAVQQVHFPI